MITLFHYIKHFDNHIVGMTSIFPYPSYKFASIAITAIITAKQPNPESRVFIFLALKYQINPTIIPPIGVMTKDAIIPRIIENKIDPLPSSTTVFDELDFVLLEVL